MYYGKGQQLYCETCEAKMEIKSDFSVLKVCANCGEVKFKYSLASPRKVLPIAESMNVLCVGTVGFIELKNSKLSGAIKFNPHGDVIIYGVFILQMVIYWSG